MTSLFLLFSVITASFSTVGGKAGSSYRGKTVENRHVFNPRMDYDEWTPLGRGDPLKNDPTYDYVPPVLDRVHYWIDPSKRTPDPPLPQRVGSLEIGARTEPSTTTDAATSRFGTLTLLDPFLKFMEESKSSLTSTVTSYFKPTPHPSAMYMPTTAYPSSYGIGPPATSNSLYSTNYRPSPVAESDDIGPPPPQPKIPALQRPPYTMLMPPPAPITSTEAAVTSFATSTISTSEATADLFILPQNTTPNDTSTYLQVTESGPEVPTSTITPTTHLANSENLYKPVAINMPELISNESLEEDKPHFLPTPTPEELTVFNDNGNSLLYEEVKLPSLIMVPPPKKSGDFYNYRPTTIRPATTARTLTTDPIFKHYKQPSEPVRGPFYLIIQGHSKVKTYGARKNKIQAVSSNEINYEDGKTKNEYDFESGENRRRERKLTLKNSDLFIDEKEAEVIEGHPTVELSSSFMAKGQPSFIVSDYDTAITDKNITESEKHISREKRFIGRRLMASTATRGPTKKPKPSGTLDEQQLGLESLIGLNEDYNSDDVINLLLKEEGQGSGVGNFVSSLFARSINPNDEI